VTGSLGIRLLDEPAATRSDPRARIYIVDRLAPGTVIHRRLALVNTTHSTLHVVLYSAAATIANGSFLGAAGHTTNELSTWTSVRPNVTDLPPGGGSTATVTIAVPHNATSGEKYAVVWAEVRSTPRTPAGVIEVSRVGIRAYISVGHGGAPASDFTINSLTAERTPAGRPLVLVMVHNTGGRALDMYGTLRLLAGPGHLSAGPFPATLGTTLGIGDTEPVTVTLDRQLPAGPWDAKITLRSGLLTHTAQAIITFPKVGAAPTVFGASSSSSHRDIVVALVTGLLLLAGAVGVGTVKRRRRRSRSDPGRAVRTA
jgi:hypothetical protein